MNKKKIKEKNTPQSNYKLYKIYLIDNITSQCKNTYGDKIILSTLINNKLVKPDGKLFQYINCFVLGHLYLQKKTKFLIVEFELYFCINCFSLLIMYLN